MNYKNITLQVAKQINDIHPELSIFFRHKYCQDTILISVDYNHFFNISEYNKTINKIKEQMKLQHIIFFEFSYSAIELQKKCENLTQQNKNRHTVSSMTVSQKIHNR